jgi:hypothetical protein
MLTHLSVPAWAPVNHNQYNSLESLSIQRAYLPTDSAKYTSRVIGSFPYLRKLSLEIDDACETVWPLVELSFLPSLKELQIKTTLLWTPTGFCAGMSESLQQLVMVGGFVISSLNQFTTLLHRLSSDTIRSMSLKNLLFVFPSSDESPWDLMLSLHSVELIGIQPIHFLHIPWAGIRKVLIDYPDPIPMEVISKILRTATRLISCSIITQRPNIAAAWCATGSTYSPECVKALCASQYLKHFQSIGPYVFTSADWRTLCGTLFKKLRLLHIVQLCASTM